MSGQPTPCHDGSRNVTSGARNAGQAHALALHEVRRAPRVMWKFTANFAHLFVSKLPARLLSVIGKRPAKVFRNPARKCDGKHIPGPASGWATAGPWAASRRRRQGNVAPALYVPCRSPGLALRGIRGFGPLPSGSPKNPSRIRISPVKLNAQFPALFARCTFAPTFREVSGGSGVQPAWALGLR